jgi:phospholipase/carboxylesterase
MNRIKLSPLASSPVTKKDSRPSKPKDAKFAFDKTTIRSDQEVSLFGPLHYEKNHAYPLIVWLHSDGQKSAQLQTIMPKISMRNYVGVAPQAPVGNFECGYFWEQDYDSIVTAEESIFKATAAACSRFNIAPERIFLAGTGSGGTMALRMAMNHPARFAGAISLGGAMPEGQNVLARWREARQSPIFWAHHLDHSTDEPAAIEDVCDHFRKLFSFGFVNLVAREYPTRELLESLTPREIDKWIMEQVQTAIT